MESDCSWIAWLVYKNCIICCFVCLPSGWNLIASFFYDKITLLFFWLGVADLLPYSIWKVALNLPCFCGWRLQFALSFSCKPWRFTLSSDLVLHVYLCGRGDPGSAWCEPMWDLWWTKWHWENFFFSPSYLVFSCQDHSVIVRNRISLTYHLRGIIVSFDRIFEENMKKFFFI